MVSTTTVLIFILPVEILLFASFEMKTVSISLRYFLFLLLKMNLEFSKYIVWFCQAFACNFRCLFVSPRCRICVEICVVLKNLLFISYIVSALNGKVLCYMVRS